MAAPRARRPGSDQNGRDARRTPRAERRSQNASGRRAPGTNGNRDGANRDRRAPASKPSGEGTDRDRSARVIGRRKSAGNPPERTIFGLSTARAVILAVVVCVLALTLAVPLRTYFTQRGEASAIEAERVLLERDIAELQEKTQQQTDPAYIAAEARDRLRLVMPGETPYQVQLPGAYEAAQAQRAEPEPEPGTWYSELWQEVSEPRPVEQAPAPPPPAPVVPPAPPAPMAPPGGPGR